MEPGHRVTGSIILADLGRVDVSVSSGIRAAVNLIRVVWNSWQRYYSDQIDWVKDHRIGSGRVGSRVKRLDQVPSQVHILQEQM